ncbi:11417_t:CDS:1, partial [Racocetra persica]
VQNPVIMPRKGRPAGWIKSSTEIQDKKLKRIGVLHSDINLNVNKNVLEASIIKDNRKT